MVISINVAHESFFGKPGRNVYNCIFRKQDINQLLCYFGQENYSPEPEPVLSQNIRRRDSSYSAKTILYYNEQSIS